MDLKKILADHQLWLAVEGGKRANLQRANLQGADLRWANLREADLQGADLRWANLRWANLRWANLREANLQEANLQRADLREADLREADLDFSCWPLWCGSVGVNIDKRLAAQLAYHLLAVWPEARTPEMLALANSFHRIPGVPKLEVQK